MNTRSQSTSKWYRVPRAGAVFVVAIIFATIGLLAACNSIPIGTHQNRVPKQNWSQHEYNIASQSNDSWSSEATKLLSAPYVERATISTIESLFANPDRQRSSDTESLYVGVAISGGGSRAANFGAAALMELENLGLLKHAKAISSVSGGSIAAAYYGLNATAATKLDWGLFRQKLKLNLRSDAIYRLLRPNNLLGVLTTHKDRSDVVAEVLDEHYFEGRTFGDFPQHGPRILINATETTGGIRPFVFSTEYFWRLGSSLREFPVSTAVMASAAFPGLLDNVTLRDFSCQRFDGTVLNRDELRTKIVESDAPVARRIRSLLHDSDVESLRRKNHRLEEYLNLLACAKFDLYDEEAFRLVKLRRETTQLLQQRNLQTFGLLNRMLLEDAFPDNLPAAPRIYRHLLDAGAADNLGIDTLEQSLASDPTAYKACLLVIVDAYTGHARSAAASREPDTRKIYDYLVNSNLMIAFDALLDSRRQLQLQERQINTDPDLPSLAWRQVGKHRCLIWRVGFDRAYAREKTLPDLLIREAEKDIRAIESIVLPAVVYSRAAKKLAESAETDLRLINSTGCSADAIQAALWDSAKFVVREDIKTLRYIFGELKLDEIGISVDPILKAQVTWHRLADLQNHPCLEGRSDDASSVVVSDPPQYLGRIPQGYRVPSTRARVAPLSRDRFNPFSDLFRDLLN